jgi:PAS domain S-box-containing protein
MNNKDEQIKSTPYEDILNFSSDAIISINSEGEIVFFNPAAQNLFGYLEDDILGLPLETILPKSIKSGHKDLVKGFNNSQKMARSMAGQRIINGLAKDGSLLNLSISIQKHPKNKNFQFTAICRDAREIKKNTDALEYSEKKLNLAQRIAKIGNWEWNIQAGTLHWSDQVYRIFGVKKSEVEPSYEKFLGFVHPNDRETLNNIISKSIEEKKSYRATHRIICPDGTLKIIQEIGELVLDDKGEPFALDGTAQDITVAWNREQEIKRAQLIAEESNHAKGLFMATMSHELRTPLNAIIGFSTILKSDQSLLDTHKEYANYIEESGQHLLELVNNVLNISKVEMDSLDNSPSHFSVRNYIESCTKLVRHLSKKKNIEIKTHVEANLPEVYLDNTHCKQILLNLITNSIKFSEKNKFINIKVRRQENMMEIKVIDQGMGINPEKLETIFEPFTQADMELSRKHEGSGLGLTIVKHLTEFMQGTIDIDSTPGKGTKVTITIPAFPDEVIMFPPQKLRVVK